MTNPTPEEGVGQTLIEHLLELRRRLLHIIYAVLGVFALLMLTSAYRHVYDWVAAPLMKVMPHGTSMIATHVTSPLLVPMELAFYVSLFVTMPYILHQVWAFVSPGLYQREKKLALPLLASSVVLFYAGCAFAYFIIFPILFKFFTTIAPSGVAVMTDIGSYLSFVMTLFVAFGVTFELPVFIILLVASGLVSHARLVQSRRYVIVACFIIAMFITPPDMFSQTLLAVPMCLLFEAGLFFSRHIKPRGESDDEEA
jgi:sec-independent protein translocase protein TatC